MKNSEFLSLTLLIIPPVSLSIKELINLINNVAGYNKTEKIEI